jgi:UDP-glucuronate 4-epimerase
VTRTAVVTGCAGFIGSHLSERLIAEGFRVRGIDAFTPYYARAEKEANLAALAGERKFELVELDLADAALEHVLATTRLFEAALAARTGRVVWASSSSVYGDAPVYPCREDTPRAPRSPYGVTKHTCEDLAAVYRERGLDSVCLRYFTVYGPRQRPDMAMRRLCEALLDGTPFPLYGDGLQSRDFTYVADAVDATLRAGLAGRPAPVYNVGGGEEATLAAVIRELESLTGRSVVLDRRAEQPGDVRRTGADTSLARRTLAWRPATGLAPGVRRELEWVAARRVLIAA